MAVKIFICYAHADEAFLKNLKTHLKPLQREGFIDVWHDRDISAGTEWEQEIDKHLNASQIILLLVSPDFLASDYCYSKEMMQAMERHHQDEALVIPIILRHTLWQGTPFHKLQALPSGSLPVKSWSDPDQAFLNIAQGIQNAAEEINIRLLARRLSLFGHETDGGRKSKLWENPAASPFDDVKFKAWCDSKRNFKKEEFINQTWIKSRGPEATYLVQFLEDGFLKESIIFDPDCQWLGFWQITADGALRINVEEYELDIFANDLGSLHTGIEYKRSLHTPFAPYVFFPHNQTTMTHWSLMDALRLVERIYDQVLERPPHQEEIIVYGSSLCRGEISVRSIIKILGLSEEYRERFISTKMVEKALESCYRHFLGREIDAVGRAYYPEKVEFRGFKWIINDLLDSDEYVNNKYGEDHIPAKLY